MREVAKKRKERSDKKIDVKPTISMPLKESIYRLSYVTNTPVKDVAEAICEAGLTSKKVMNLLSIHFRRDYRIGNTFYLGDLDRPSLQKQRIEGKRERITIRFTKRTNEILKALAYALDCTPSKSTAILLEASVCNSNFINDFTKKYLQGQLDENRMRELKKVIHFINHNNPYAEKVSWATLLSYLYDDLKMGANSLSSTLSDWIDNMK